ncbi:MAG: DUF4397 domain-containing protein [Chlorobi bacterium]|nr:DUF4397 domain-containing protein [Chlorobiota bacterium]
MPQLLLRKFGTLAVFLAGLGIVLSGCIDEPTIAVPQRPDAKVRFVHAVADASGPVDIYVDDKLMVAGFMYKQYTDYFSIPAGTRQLRIVPAGQDTASNIYHQILSIPAKKKMTIFAIGRIQKGDVSLYSANERNTYSVENDHKDSADVRIFHAVYGAGPVDLVINDASGKTIVSNIPYGFPSSYYLMKAGTYKFYPLSGGVSLLSNEYFEQTIDEKHRYSFVLVGDVVNAEVLVLLDD